MRGLAGVVVSSPRRHLSSTPRGGADAGVSLLELLIVLCLGAVVITGTLSVLGDVRRERAGREAARLLMHELQGVAYAARLGGRSLAVLLSSPNGADASLQVFADGNGNGVRVAEVAAGVDVPTGPARRAFAEGTARLAILHDIPTTDQTSVLVAGSAPVRFGIAPYISFSARRTGPSGSIYIAGPSGAQYAIRVLGTTGRLRLLCLDGGSGTWRGC